ncbi:flavodoxin family protein [Desulfonatronospira sp.]|uniref:flavodoxin family protein n=1 Tax=Desulfonatronospira sp. TaxID=1962951 RepID=UPI0025BF816E|nr:flavodoxin family protein [Desulfonatronospira sp.]
MKVMAFNGSPRQEGWNTVTLLEHALQGAESAGARTELVQLYSLDFSGCISCFACKRLDREEDGVCALQDDLSPVLDRVQDCDALIIGTPVYYGTESSGTRAFLERLCFPYLKYDPDRISLFPKRINTAMIYTMNVPENKIQEMGFDQVFNMTKKFLQLHFGSCELLLSTDTLQYPDYDLYEAKMFDKEAKYQRHHQVFPQDCQRARELGKRMASSQA